MQETDPSPTTFSLPPSLKAGHLLCFGLGFTARILAAGLLKAGWQISGTARSPEGVAKIEASGLARGLLFNRDTPLPAEALEGVTHVLVSIPPDDLGDPVLSRHKADLQNLGSLQWVGYLSTTGVYGDTGGDWVDENTPVRPDVTRSVRRAAAEEAWLGAALPAPVQVFRLAGIYGPGRSAIDNLKKGSAKRIIKPGQVFCRIHVADIAATLAAAMARPKAGPVFNVCDDLPAPPQDVISYGADLLQMPEPPAIPFEQADLSPMAKSFYADNRRVKNERLKAELGVRLKFPTYKQGLASLLGDLA